MREVKLHGTDVHVGLQRLVHAGLRSVGCRVVLMMLFRDALEDVLVDVNNGA